MSKENGQNGQAVYLTAEGLAKLKEELDWRVTVRRPEIAAQIAAAKADGDISENAGYDEAKYQAGMNEGRVQELEAKIKMAVIIEASDGPAEFVDLGRTVTVRDAEFDDIETYTIVGYAEADPSNGRISNESPMGKALMGRRVGESVSVTTPGGQFQFSIVNIE